MSRETKAQRKRRVLFRRGAAAAQRYTGSFELYLCPICRTAFTQSALLTDDPTDEPELTLEHAPPKSVGGKDIALTCKGCNSTAGHSTDAAISGRANVLRFANAITHNADGVGGRAALEIGGERVHIHVVAESNGSVRLGILGASNNDLCGTVKRLSAYMQEHAREHTWTGGELIITSQARYNPRLALVGDLRAAFIVAFAAFGYRYAFDPRLEPVRQQILHPDEQVIDGWNIALNQTGDNCSLLLLTEPLSDVVVTFNGSHILLPGLDSPVNFYDALAATYRPNERLQVSGRYVAWPTTLEMVLDFQ